MKNTKLIFAALLLAGSCWLYSSCQKEHMSLTQQSSSPSIRSASDEAYIDHQSSYIDGIVQAVTWDNAGLLRDMNGLPDCATVTYDTSGTVKTATIDFGSTPCKTNGEEEYRQGILMISWTGKMMDSGTVKTITTQNYFVGDTPIAMHQFNLTKTLTNMGKNAGGNLHFAIVVTNATLTLDSGQQISWSANRDREWVQGDTTTNSDDIFYTTGGSSGVDRNGEPFTVEITTAVRRNADCEWPVSGIKLITHGSHPARTLDYGDGTCDNFATVTVNGQTTTILIDKDE